jgi:hypothetical protein
MRYLSPVEPFRKKEIVSIYDLVPPYPQIEAERKRVLLEVQEQKIQRLARGKYRHSVGRQHLSDRMS